MNIETHYVNSSVIDSIRYNTKTEELKVLFTDGSETTYLWVPEEEVDGLIDASSAGAYFNHYIRDNYPRR